MMIELILLVSTVNRITPIENKKRAVCRTLYPTGSLPATAMIKSFSIAPIINKSPKCPLTFNGDVPPLRSIGPMDFFYITSVSEELDDEGTASSADVTVLWNRGWSYLLQKM